MPKSPKPPVVADPGDENERPTVVPPFDVEAMAREYRGPSNTLVDAEELEAARVASMRRSSLPPARERPGEDPIVEIVSGPDSEVDRSLSPEEARALLDRVPRLAVSVDKLVTLPLDHRAGFLISFVDGVSSIATIVDISSMDPDEVLRTFVDLNARGIIAF